MKFWEVKNSAGNEGELLLYGDIASDKPWWSDGQFITPEDFLNDVAKLKDKTNITIRINSGGGDVFVALAIYAQLKGLSATKTVIVEGLAASAATIIVCAGDVVKMPVNAMYMIHDPAVYMWDYCSITDLERTTEALKAVKDSIIESYLSRSKVDKDELAVMMQKETWLTAREAVEKGFADQLLFDKESIIDFSFSNDKKVLVVNNVSVKMEQFKNMPDIGINTSALKAAEVENISNKNEEESKSMNLEELIKNHPDIVKEIQAAAKKEGALEERERIKNIEKISNSIDPDLIMKAKFETPIDAKEMAFQNAVRESEKGAKYTNDATADSLESGVKDVEGVPEKETDTGKGVNDKSGKVKNLASFINEDARRTK